MLQDNVRLHVAQTTLGSFAAPTHLLQLDVLRLPFVLLFAERSEESCILKGQSRKKRIQNCFNLKIISVNHKGNYDLLTHQQNSNIT